MSKILKSSGAMAVATLTSRVLGMAREVVYANFMGDTRVAAAFKLAFTIPNLFRRLLGEGALVAAFLPVFKEKEKTEGEAEMWKAANAVISGLLVSASIIVAIVMIGISITLKVHTFTYTTDLLLRLLWVMFPYMLLVCLAAAFMGMLNARGHFFIPAMGAASLNVVMIASVLWLAPWMGGELDHQIFALAIGVLAAGVAQAAFQLPSLWRDGFRYRWVSPWGNQTVRIVVARMIPGTIGIAAFQINVLLTAAIAFKVDPQISASFDYAVRLMELPQGIVGISLATVLLPTLSGLAAEKNYDEFRNVLRHGIGTLIFLNLFSATLLLVLAHPIVRLLFERGQFSSASTDRATIALMCLAPGLIAFSTVNIVGRAFFALGDTKTPMKISIFCLALNIVLAAAMVKGLRQGGLGIANTVTSICNASLLLYALKKRLGKLDMETLRPTLLPLAIGAAISGVIAWYGLQAWERFVGYRSLSARVGAVFVPAIFAAIVYWIIAVWGKVPAPKEITDLILQKARGRDH